MTSLAVSAVLWLAMIAASARSAVTLAADARIPVHCGSVEHCFFVSKRAGLVIWPVVGAVLFGVLGGITASSLAAGWVAGVRDVLVPAVMGVVLAFQVGALAMAARSGSRAGDDGGVPAGNGSAGPGPAARLLARLTSAAAFTMCVGRVRAVHCPAP
jgi:hypothetical protein